MSLFWYYWIDPTSILKSYSLFCSYVMALELNECVCDLSESNCALTLSMKASSELQLVW